MNLETLAEKLLCCLHLLLGLQVSEASLVIGIVGVGGDFTFRLQTLLFFSHSSLESRHGSLGNFKDFGDLIGGVVA